MVMRMVNIVQSFTSVSYSKSTIGRHYGYLMYANHNVLFDRVLIFPTCIIRNLKHLVAKAGMLVILVSPIGLSKYFISLDQSRSLMLVIDLNVKQMAHSLLY